MKFFEKKQNQLLIIVILVVAIILTAAVVCLWPSSAPTKSDSGNNVGIGNSEFGKGMNFDPNNVFSKYTAKENVEIIKSKELTVVMDKTKALPLAYQLSNGAYMLGAGELTTDYYTINEKDYKPEVSYKKLSASSVEYTLKFKDVKLSSSVTENLTVCYEFKVEGNELVKKMKSLEGDDAKCELWIMDTAPMLQVDGQMSDSGVAASSSQAKSGQGNKIEDMIGKLSELKSGRIPNSSFSFVWNNGAAGTIYTPSAFTNPYTAEIKNDGASSKAVIYAGTYYHRLAGGTRVEKEDTSGNVSEVLYEARVGIVSDTNLTNSVDWQDAALWLKGEIPQMTEDLYEYLQTGSWGQTIIAFPSSTYLEDSKNLPAYSFIHGSLEQYLNAQKYVYNMTDGIGKNAYCMVGWQGRGHDYGWPDLSEQIVNPAIGDTKIWNEYQKKFAEYGGVLSFHVNQSDISSASLIYSRPETDTSKFGNSSIWLDKETTNVGTEYFGWTAYTLSHYTDFIKGYALTRHDAFIDKYYAPFIMYMDVFTNHPYGDYGAAEEEYAKAREIQHWKANGVNVGTEYYSQEKYLNGQQLFLGTIGYSIIDCFMMSGNAKNGGFSQADDRGDLRVWGYLGTNGGSLAQKNNSFYTDMVSNLYTDSFLNCGILWDAGLLSYEETDEYRKTVWGDGIVAEYNKGTDLFTVKKNGNIIALGGDVIFPVPDDKDRVLVYCKVGREATWRLPEQLEDAKNVVLYKLTPTGRTYIETLKVEDKSVTFTMSGDTSYLLEKGKKSTKTSKENLAVLSTTSGSSKDDTGKNVNNESANQITLSVPKSKAPTGNWNDTLKTLLPSMFDQNGGIKYEWPCRPSCTVDGDSNTWWQPNGDTSFEEPDLADGEAYIEYKFDSKKTKVSSVKIKEISADSDKVTKFKIQGMSGGKFVTLYEGSEIPDKAITFDTIETSRIRIVILSAKSNTPRIAEVEIYG